MAVVFEESFPDLPKKEEKSSLARTGLRSEKALKQGTSQRREASVVRALGLRSVGRDQLDGLNQLLGLTMSFKELFLSVFYPTKERSVIQQLPYVKVELRKKKRNRDKTSYANWPSKRIIV